jgi:transposase InsO family protein
MVKKATAVDPCLSKVMQYTMTGWPQDVDLSFSAYKNKVDELSVEQGCLLWGLRVVVPTTLRERVLQELHETHPGMTRMKSIARSYVWWPSIDSDIEKTVRSCHVCQVTRADPAGAPVHPWCYPTGPWQRLHIDFKGPVQGQMFLVVVDAYSKYPEVVKMSSTTSTATFKVLREIFSRQGLPETIVSDNGPQLTSEEFENFCSVNGIIHRRSAPYKPSTNGQARVRFDISTLIIGHTEITTDTYIFCIFLSNYYNGSSTGSRCNFFITPSFSILESAFSTFDRRE